MLRRADANFACGRRVVGLGRQLGARQRDYVGGALSPHAAEEAVCGVSDAGEVVVGADREAYWKVEP